MVRFGTNEAEHDMHVELKLPVDDGTKHPDDLARLASPCCLYGGDVYFLHGHHCLEGTLCFIATGCHGFG
jgi:hypothetical protein